MRRAFISLLLLALFAFTALAAFAWQWLEAPMPLRDTKVQLTIDPGSSAKRVAESWVAAGVNVPAPWLAAWFRFSGRATAIRAGSYAIEAGETPRALLERMVRGDEALAKLQLIEGWTARQFRAALAKAPGVAQTTAQMSDAEVAAAIGLPAGTALEGQLFPDTYAYGSGVSDVFLLQRAHAAMQRELAKAWDARASDSPLKSPADLLTLASVVEKETGHSQDRGLVAGVFNNRLKIGMPLQSDPTIIYGLAERFDGNLRRADLQADGPYNSYTRGGLPPTPICMPSRASLLATARPDDTRALYFVAKGDGRSAFSETLAEHNRAVDRYQRGQGSKP